MSELVEKAKLLKKSSFLLGVAKTQSKNNALLLVAKEILQNKETILVENQKDVEEAKRRKVKRALIDRLELNPTKLLDISKSIEKVAQLADPIGKSQNSWQIENGLKISKVAVPMGVLGIIYESRPNVTADAFALALKSGNSILLRGSSSAINSNKIIVSVIKQALQKSKISPDIVQIIENTDRKIVEQMLHLTEYIDLIIPRGGAELINLVVKNSSVKTIETGVGNCHIFVDESADFDVALKIIENAKVQRPGVCNSCEKVIVHQKLAKVFLPKLYESLKDKVKLIGCAKTQQIIKCQKAKQEDWALEYLDYILGIKVVENIGQAIAHINKYGSKHSEAIITKNYANSEKFLALVDAAAVYVNASTRFTDGGVFGFGCEMGISTQKMHVRGPMGLDDMVTNKYIIRGEGQVRE